MPHAALPYRRRAQIRGSCVARCLLSPHAYRFLKSIEGKGDLYGPFWVATTLIFAIAFSGNIVDYKNSVGKGEQDVWRYDFDKGAGRGGKDPKGFLSL